MNFEKYIGIPYLEKGRDESGVDCWGLVRLIYKNELQIDLPSFSSEYTQTDTERIEDLIAQYKEGWQETSEPTIGSIVLFRVMGNESHVGVVISSTHFIHVRENQDSVIESLTSTSWIRRKVGYFNYSEKKSAVLNAVPHPLRTERYTIPVVPGTTLKVLAEGLIKEYGIAPELKSKISVMVNGMLIPQEKWETVILKEGDAIEYRAVPTGSAGRMLALVAVMIVAPQLAGMAEFAYMGTAGATVAGSAAVYATAYAATVIAGSYLINTIAPIRPPAEPRDPGSSERQLMVNGGSNQANPYGAIPVILGKVRSTPLLGSTNFLTYENESDSYLSMLLVWGYGPLDIDEGSLRVGDVPLNSFDNVTQITLNRKTEPSEDRQREFDSIYGKDITQINTSVELVCDGNPETAVAPGPWFEAATDIEYDPITQAAVPVTAVTVALHFPQGLRGIRARGDASGESFVVNVGFNLEFSINSGASWAPLDSFGLGSDSPKRDAFTYTKTYYNLNYSKMLVRVRRTTGDNVEDNPDNRYYFTAVLQNVTFLRNNKPALDPVGAKIAKTAFKIRANKQLNGNIQGINAIVQTWCKTWNGVSWVDGATSNPAALMRYVLEHPANPRKVINANSQINLTQLQYFYNYCQARGFEYNGVLGQSRSVLEVIRDICAAGRASPALIDGKWTVIIDEAKPNVIQHFTPHNSWGFEASKALPKRPDGLRVTYYDQDRDYQESEIIVYEIGKNSGNASLFESITLPGVTKNSLVIDHARWHFAQMKLRPEIYSLNCDIEYLVCNRGDRVKVMHDVPMWGLGSGRVKSRISDTVLELDEDVPMQFGVSYTIRFRSVTGSSVTRTVVSPPQDGYYNTITLTNAISALDAGPGDLFLFGSLNQEAQDLIVLSIEPSNNNTARITLVDYGVTPEYNIFNDYLTLSASTVFEAQITLPPSLQVDAFSNKIPQITGFLSDESVMERVSKGIFKYNINVAYVNALQLPTNTESIEIEYDLVSSEINVNTKSVIVPFQKGSGNIGDVKEGETYKVRMRYVGTNGKTGKWTAYSTHTVVGKINPPSQVTGFKAEADRSSGQIKLSWGENLEPDTYTYEVRKTNTEWGLDNNNRVFFGDSVSAFTQYINNSPTIYYIKAVDSSGNYSLLSSSATFITASLQNIVNLEHSYYDTSLTNATVILTWSEVPVQQFDVAYYEISYIDGVEAVVNTVKSNTITLPANWIGNRAFTVKTVDIHGNKSSGYTGNITKLAPNPVTDYRAQVIDNNVLLYWVNGEKTSLPIAHVLLKKSIPTGNWQTASVVGTKSGEFTSISELSGGEFIYWLAAIDTDDRESTPVQIPVTVSQPPDFKFTAEFISTLEGTLSNAKSYAGELFLPVNTSETWSSHFSSNSWSTPSAQVAAGYPIFIQPGTTDGFYEEIFDYGTMLSSSQITLNSIETDVAGSTTSSTAIYTSADGVAYTNIGSTGGFATNFRFLKIRINVSQNTVGSIRKISDLRVRLDSKQKSEAGYAVVPEAGKIVNFDAEFIDVQSIILTPSGTVPVISVYDFKDEVVTGTYTITSNIATITAVNHGLIAGQKVRLFFTTGNGIPGVYVIQSIVDANSYTVNMLVANTSGNVTTYPNSMVIYSFTSNTGVAVASTTSYQIKGY